LLRQQLDYQHSGDSQTVIVEELGVLHGSSRIDLAVVNGTLHGYELKSDRDTLKLLPEQADSYSAVFDLVTLVVGERHLLAAIDLIPGWWGVKVARMGSEGLLFRDLKLPTMNPSPDPISVARLLWREEALHILEEIDTRKSNHSKSRDRIYAELVTLLAFDLLRDNVRRSLKNRLVRQSDEIRASCDG